jgi:hypothetical protein
VKVDLAIERTAEAERELAEELLQVGGRHSAEHDVFHITRTRAEVAQANLERLSRAAARYGTAVDREPSAGGGVIGTVREKTSELLGRRPEAGLLLLADLEQLHLRAARASLAWTALAQAAQAAKDRELLSIASECHPETLRTLRWTTQKVKEAAPQALASG